MVNEETKWDKLYNPGKKSLFSKLEEFAINAYFSQAFTKSILSISNINEGKILEPGSGGGMTCAKFAELGFDVTSMDLSSNALRKGVDLFKSLSLDAKFFLGDLFRLPIKDEQFDVVFNQGVMEHFRLAELDASDGIKEMLRVLKKNGTLIVYVPAFFSPLFFIYRIFKIFNLIDKHWPYTDQDFLHKHELEKMLIDGGCQEVKVRRVWSTFFFSMVGYCKK
jgi:SAM-dependent methyltransferase|tara:strand:+ start:1616 stop:2281 length:666 start_codon:yes stop_codon:yes gene_type:complete